jgi:predicted nucleic acid-binding protein
VKNREPTLYTLDTSVITKTLLLDDELIDQTRDLVSAFGRSELFLVVPLIAQYETASTIPMAVRERQMSDQYARIALEALFDFAVPVVGDVNETRDIVLRAYPIARELACSLNQASFLVVSASLDAPLITADRDFLEAAAGSFNVIWLGELQLP